MGLTSKLLADTNGRTSSAIALSTAQMTGEAARENMSGLDFETTWTTTESYPKLRVPSDESSPENTQPRQVDVTGNGEPAQDTNDDGLANDINDDGEFSMVDVQLLFENRNSVAVQNNPKSFDFSGDGQIGIADVQVLFEQQAS